MTNPQQNLSVAGGANIDQGNRNAGSLDQGLRFGSSSGEGIASQRTGGGNQYGLDIYTNSTARLSITNSGNIGIGTGTPGNFRLMVAGGDTRIAAVGAEQSLFGLDKLVGLNDLRFYVDDSGTTERMHLSSSGLTVHGSLSWDEDHSCSNFIVLGSMKLCWGTTSGNVPNYENHLPVTFPSGFSSPLCVRDTQRSRGRYLRFKGGSWCIFRYRN